MGTPDMRSAAHAKPPLLSRAAWVRVLPFIVYLSFFLIADVLARLGMTPDALRWLYPVKTVAVAALLALFWREYTELHRWDLGLKGALIAIGAGLLVFILWINMSAGWMLIGAPAGYDPGTAAGLDWTLVVIRLAGAALVVPVMEELFWRSFLMRWIDKNDFLVVDAARVSLQSVAIAAVLFGFEHHQWLAGIVAGLAYSLLYMRLRSLWAAVLAHAVTNGVLGIWVVQTGNWSFW